MADTGFAPIFTDHAVLQRGKEIRLWGNCRPQSALRIALTKESGADGLSSRGDLPKQAPAETLAERCFSSNAFPDGHFFAALPAMEAGGPYALTLSEDGRPVQVLRDIMVGEVWLAGGQSNMEFELQNDADAPACDYTQKKIRFYQVPRLAYFDADFEAREREGGWSLPTALSLRTWSAVACHFAALLSDALGCFVGVIGCSWGGTSASAWQDKRSLLAHPKTRCYWEEYEAALASRSSEEYEREREDYLLYQERWQPKIDAFYRDNPRGSWEEALAFAGPCRWPGPMGPKHEFRPCGLYETMLLRVAPYAMQGFLYYQGESDDHHPESYHALLTSLVRAWRRDFADESLWFLNVQLPMHRYANEDALDSWALIREAQMRLYREDPRSGLAVAIDRGEFDNIHPAHKKEVGRRLYLQSMAHVYHKIPLSKAHGPLLKRALPGSDQRSVLLEFDFSDAGFDRERYETVLSLADGGMANALHAFEAAGEDGVFFPVEAVFAAGDTAITLRLPPDSPAPVCVRYLWANYSLVPLFDKGGMPAAPFRCDLS